jgi:hypothetical protein
MKGRSIISVACLVGLAGLAGAALGCGRTVTEADCTRIKDNMREAWATESKKAAPEAAAGSEKAAAAIKAQGDKLSDDWMTECKRELMGKRAEPKEMDCLFQATTIAAINKCTEAR